MEGVVAQMGVSSDLESLREFWKDRRVLVTGHTGFKGGWLGFWLSRLGAQVFGFALAPPSHPSFFEAVGLGSMLDHREGDVRSSDAVLARVREVSPEIVFHLAAQALVRPSYERPTETFDTNVMGTIHLLEAIRQVKGVRSVVVITSDKVYENREWVWGYREVDPLGGHDPYSASKAAAEIAVRSWRGALMNDPEGPTVATVRAGNVVGGGDYAECRLIPDAVRALSRGMPVPVRSPRSIRPWQHVLEPLCGYLQLAQATTGNRDLGIALNFGPSVHDARQVSEVMDEFVKGWGGDASWRSVETLPKRHEARTLVLCSDLANEQLGWRPRWSLKECLRHTVAWYKAHTRGATAQELRALTWQQIETYLGAHPA